MLDGGNRECVVEVPTSGHNTGGYSSTLVIFLSSTGKSTAGGQVFLRILKFSPIASCPSFILLYLSKMSGQILQVFKQIIFFVVIIGLYGKKYILYIYFFFCQRESDKEEHLEQVWSTCSLWESYSLILSGETL